MLSGIKFISREEIDTEKGGGLGGNEKDIGGKSRSKREKNRAKYGSSDDEGLERIKKGSRKKKWYSSDECSESSSEEDDESDSSGGGSEKKRSRKRKGKSRDRVEKKGKKSGRSKRKKNTSEDSSSDDKEDERRGRREGKSKSREKSRKVGDLDGEGGSSPGNNIDIVRKEMGLDWMLRPDDRPKKTIDEKQPVEPPSEEPLKANPKEMNPYWRDNGAGFPEDEDQATSSRDKLLSSSLVGDGGASWRLKALKRAKEQAEREGRNLKEVVKERWGDLGHLAVSVSSRSAAAPRAHLRAIHSRKAEANDETDPSSTKESDRHTEKVTGRDYLKDVSLRHPEMKAPRSRDSLSWGKRKGPNFHDKDAALISSAISGINKFANDGNFMSQITNQQDKFERSFEDAPKSVETREAESNSSTVRESSEQRPQLSANQLAAKAMQLRLKGKHEEADKLMKEADRARVDESVGNKITKIRNDVSSSRYAAQERSLRQKGKEDDSDIHLAQTIMKNKQYNMATQADDEYEYGEAPSKKSKRKAADRRSEAVKPLGKRIMTQQERCSFCFENPQRPKHLVVAIANFTYLMLPQFTPVAPGHCCIVTLQHELATRMVDDNVWEEIRNFKKCLIMMFAKQSKEVIFLETVLWLSQQRRHCMIECVPLPQDVAKDGPLYFKKAIDEAESEWSQHDAKKLIDTSQKGLRGSIPKDFPYVHVEFGLNKGFVHVIDDETQFKSSFGLNVIRGMLQSQDEDMYRRRRYESLESQKQAVAEFAKEWAPFDWTKQLD
ncbi:hypothetical protein RND81_08G219100 [Saponaria officinalis]|uniref:CWF19-like protein 2 n=1 Tax=Saponaria officinalis TaxID=3572 RepID=A0AAW1JBT0_SAPOF